MRLAAWVLCLLLAACSTSSVAPDAVGAVDAASGPQPIGSPCDPALAVPCLPTGDGCLGVRCVGGAASFTCAEYELDAGPTCNGGAARCATSADCDLGLTCAFPIGGGCSDGDGGTGECLDPPLPCEDDAAACGAGPGTVCACDGLLAPVLIPGYAAAPTPAGAGAGGECAPADSGLSLDDGQARTAGDGGAGD